MKKQILKNLFVRSPTLDTVTMVEKTIEKVAKREKSEAHRINEFELERYK